MKDIKLKAIIEMILVVSLSIIFSLEISSLNSPSVLAVENVCCEKTTDGAFCQYVSADKCTKDSKKSPTTCDQASFCRPGCCDMNDFNQGCFKNVAKGFCGASNGSFSADASCSTSQCSSGCCIVGNQASFTTETGCKALTAVYPSLPVDFRPEITTELECVNIVLKQQSGCCVSSDGCKRLTEGECDSKDGKFYNNMCRALDKGICEECKGAKTKNCVDGADDVFYFDSCGNQEGKAEICDYASGTLCGQTNDKEFTCLNTDCSTTWDNKVVADDGGYRKNGESWCEYDADAGPTKDLPGTRHFRHYCYNGKEVVEPCRDFREEICIQAKFTDKGSELSAAGCRKNRVQDCGTCTSEECCVNSAIRDCIWISPSKEQIDELQKTVESKRNDDRTIEVSYEEGGGLCLPLVPLGLKFWEANGGVQDTAQTAGGGAICDFVDMKEGGKQKPITSTWEHKTALGDWDCETNCIAYTDKYANAMNDLCSAYGDCGAKYNLAGVYSNKAFTRTCDRGEDNDLLNDAGDVDSGEDYTETQSLKEYYEPFSGSSTAKSMLEMCTDRIEKPKSFEESWAYYTNHLTIENMGDEFQSQFKQAFLGLGIAIGAIGAVALALTSMGATFMTTACAAAGVAWLPVAGWIAAAVIVLTSIAIYLTTEQYDATLPIECNMWTQPTGSDYCHLCHEAGKRADGVDVDYTANGLHECTEYMCKSLGAECKFVTTDEGGKCIGGLCEGAGGDVTAPIIVPIPGMENSIKCTPELQDGKETSCVIERKGGVYGGYDITPYVKPFSDVTFGIQTCRDGNCAEKDYSDCRFDTKMKANIDEMSGTFSSLGNDSSGALGFYHNFTLLAGTDLLPNSNHTIYVRCMDSCGNGKNSPPYEIKFKVADGPDLTAPSLVKQIPASNSYVAFDSGAVDVELILNERVGGGKVENNITSGCRYSIGADAAYKEMPNALSCPAPTMGNQQRCTALLKNLTLGENTFYFKCADRKGNENKESLPKEGYKLIKTGPMNITAVKCINPLGENCGDIFSLNLTLQAFTYGGARDGEAVCGLSTANVKNAFETDFFFFETNASVHSINLGPLDSRTYNYWIVCSDVANNVAKQFVNFTIIVDKKAPEILEIHKDAGSVKLRTNEFSTCKYQTNGTFKFENANAFTSSDGVVHSAAVDATIRAVTVACLDRFGNLGSSVNVYLL